MVSYDEILDELARIKKSMDEQGEVIALTPFGGACYKALRIYDNLYDQAVKNLEKLGWYERVFPWQIWEDWRWVLRTHWCI